MDNMDDEQLAHQMISLPSINIIKKLRTKVDRQNFCRENIMTTIFII